MKISVLTTALVCIVSLGLNDAVLAAPSPSPSPSPSATTGTLYNGFLLGTKIVGSHVMNLQKQDIGTIDDLIVNPDTGRIRFAVLSVGGFLGMGDTKVVAPWGAIGLEKNKPGEAPTYVVDATKDRLEKAPKFDPNKLQDLYASANAQPIFDFYSITFFDDLPAGSPSPSPSPATHKP